MREPSPRGLASRRAFLAGGAATAGLALASARRALAAAAEEGDVAGLVQAARSHSAAVAAARAVGVLAPTARYSYFSGVGQSLWGGAEGGPALSVEPYPGLLTIGDLARGKPDPDKNVWVPFGPAEFRPLVSRNFVGGSLRAPLDPTQKPYPGESILPGMLRHARAQWLAGQNRKVDGEREFVGVVNAQGGTPIELLIPNRDGDPAVWNRLKGSVALARRIAGGASLQDGGFVFLGGESNYTNGPLPWGGASTGTREGFLALMRSMRESWLRDVHAVLQGGDGDALPPLLTYQVRSRGNANALDLGVGMAQLDFGLAYPHTACVGPLYQLPDHGIHLFSNSYRWLGHQFGKVMARLWAGHRWEPMRPLKVVVKGRTVLVPLHVPVGEAVFDRPYDRGTRVDVADRGFSLGDRQGGIGVAGVEIVGGRVVRIETSRAPREGLWVRYAAAGKAQDGMGMVRDTDPSVADEVYEWLPDLMKPEEEIAELIGKPYPLHNWLVAFHLEA